MINVLFVCLGNICRSPMAEGLFIHIIKEKELESQFRIDSAGTGGWHAGEPADPRMLSTAANHGIELPSRARKVRPQDFEDFEYILAMDESNYLDLLDIQATVPNGKAQLFKMRSFDPEARGADVPDPYYGGRAGFERVYDMLERSCNELLTHILSEVSVAEE